MGHLQKEKKVDRQDAVIMRKEQHTPIDPDKCVSGRADVVLDDIVDQDEFPLNDSDDDCDVQTVIGESDLSIPIVFESEEEGGLFSEDVKSDTTLVKQGEKAGYCYCWDG